MFDYGLAKFAFLYYLVLFGLGAACGVVCTKAVGCIPQYKIVKVESK